MSRRIVILTEGFTEPVIAKTASCMIRYRGSEVVALVDSTQAGKHSGNLLGVGQVPIVASLAEAGEADTLLIGIANPGGKIPPAWRAVIAEAISRGMNVVSGMHQFLSDDAEFAGAAAKANVQLVDVRNCKITDVARYPEICAGNTRVLTVGHDCSVGKMVTSVEIVSGLKARGVDAKFAATGQTGIMVEGDGYPIDCMVADFVSGAAERLVMENQHHDVTIVEGQGSLVHPSYSGVTLGLLHGSRPHAMILCYEAGRETVLNLPTVRIPPLEKIKSLCETMAGIFATCPTIGIAINSRRLSDEQAAAERDRIEREFNLPACDVIRDGPGALVDAVMQFHAARTAR